MIDRVYLEKIAGDYGFVLSDSMLENFDCYAKMLVEWNEKINLTAITEPEEIVVKHFLDSLLLAQAVELKNGATLIDVGTGAGFPSVPVHIFREDLMVTLLDSLNKRVVFLQELSAALGQKNQCVHARAEEAGQNKQYREKYDFSTARAVAHLRELCEYCLPFVKVGGCFVALKGYDVEQELEEAKKAISLLGGRVKEVKKYELPMDNRRSVIVIEKISQTSTGYPRTSAKMAKKPLIY